MNSQKIYITTTLPYVNADPHIGHALEFIQADAIARYFRANRGEENVLLNVGTDEHGLKVFTKAKEAGKTPQEYADHFASRWQEFCQLFNISYNSFYRTTSSQHKQAAQEFWRKSAAAGDIYNKRYEGLYCVGCEAFKTDKELVDGKCPEHNAEPIAYAEENYFFRLSKYKQTLLDYYDRHPEVVQPPHKLNELRNWISEMEDISVSRVKENLPWGIDVPDDPEQVLYVWFDALTNYVNVLGFGTDEDKLQQWWPGIQAFGPDNLRFQGAIWQGMLASVGLPFTKKLLCHGMILAADGTKMSKTVGNVVSPFEQAERWGVEAVRYYMLSGISTYADSAYKEDDLVAIYNSHLADNYGNLLSRVVHLAQTKGIKLNRQDQVSADFKQQVDSLVHNTHEYYQQFELQLALQQVNELASFGNKYIDQHKPWDKDKDIAQVDAVLNNLSYLLSWVTKLYSPVIPQAAALAEQSLKEQNKIILFKKIEA